MSTNGENLDNKDISIKDIEELLNDHQDIINNLTQICETINSGLEKFASSVAYVKDVRDNFKRDYTSISNNLNIINNKRRATYNSVTYIYNGVYNIESSYKELNDPDAIVDQLRLLSIKLGESTLDIFEAMIISDERIARYNNGDSTSLAAFAIDVGIPMILEFLDNRGSSLAGVAFIGYLSQDMARGNYSNAAANVTEKLVNNFFNTDWSLNGAGAGALIALVVSSIEADRKLNDSYRGTFHGGSYVGLSALGSTASWFSYTVTANLISTTVSSVATGGSSLIAGMVCISVGEIFNRLRDHVLGDDIVYNIYYKLDSRGNIKIVDPEDILNGQYYNKEILYMVSVPRNGLGTDDRFVGGFKAIYNTVNGETIDNSTLTWNN